MADKQEIQGMENNDDNTFSVIVDDDKQNSKQPDDPPVVSSAANQQTQPTSGDNPQPMDDEQKKEQPEGGANEGKYLVCKGAICQCSQGSLKVQLEVKNDHYIINSNGQDKLLATVIENNFMPALFGTCNCNKQSNNCIYKPNPNNKWNTNDDKNLPTADDEKVVVETSKLSCPLFSQGEITLITNGQTVNAASADAEQTDTAAANAICCTSEPVENKEKEKEKEKEKIKAPSVDKISYKSIYSEKGKIKEITIRTKTPATFNAESGSVNKQIISWAIWDRKGDEAQPSFGAERTIFWYNGDTLTTEFAAEGDYFIEGFGRMNPNSKVAEKNKRTQIWTGCMFLVHVQNDNKIIKIAGEKVKLGLFDIDDADKEYKLSTGTSYIFKPEFLFTPTEEDVATLSIKLYTNDKETELKSFEGKEALAFALNLDCDGVYYIKGSICGSDSSDNPKIVAVANEMINLKDKTYAIEQKPTAKARPDTPITFTANLRNSQDADKVEWTIDGNSIGKGKTLTVPKLSLRNKPHTVTAEYKRTILGTTLHLDKQKIEYTIAIQKVTSVTLSRTQVASGTTIDITISTVFADNNNGKEILKYQVWHQLVSRFSPQLQVEEKAEIGQKLTYTPKAIGIYIVKACINDTEWISSPKLQVIACQIEVWEFCDSQKIKRKKLGWGQEVYIHAKIAGMENQSAKVHLWYDNRDDDKDNRFYEITDGLPEDMQMQSFDSSGEILIKVCDNEATWAQINELRKDEKKIRLCFTVERDMICLNSKQNAANKKNNIHPAQTEQALYDGSTIEINTKNKEYDGVFLNGKGEETIEILPYGEKVTAVAYVMNSKDSYGSKNKYRMEIWENRTGILTSDAKVMEKGGLQPNEEGAIKVEINTNSDIKESDHDAKKPYKPRLFYFELYDEDADKRVISYPDSGRDKYDLDLDSNKSDEYNSAKIVIEDNLCNLHRNYFKQLKLAKDTKFNKAINIAAVKIGYKTKKEDEWKNENCYCNRDFTVDEIKSLVKAVRGSNQIWEKQSTLDDKTFEALTRELNAGFRKYHIDHCIQKIAILAETSIETGFFMDAEENPSQYASSKSKYKGRGMIQLTGDFTNEKPGIYAAYQNEQAGGYDLKNHPEYIAEKIHLIVDSGCWFFATKKHIPHWTQPTKQLKNETDAKFKQRKDAFKWKRDYFAKATQTTKSNSLSDAAEFMADEEEKYFFLISKLCHGYGLYETTEKPKSLNYDKRLNNLAKIKAWFKYDKNVCEHVKNKIQTNGKKAPWVEIALQEYNAYNGLVETQSPLKERVATYFKSSSYKTGIYSDPWCAAFISWCFKQTDYNKIPEGSARAFSWKADSWTNGETCEAFVGALIIFSWSHVAIIIGETNDGKKYVYLGGNQGAKAKGQQKICLSSISKKSSSIASITKPKDYIIKQEEYILPKYNVTTENSKTSTR